MTYCTKENKQKPKAKLRPTYAGSAVAVRGLFGTQLATVEPAYVGRSFALGIRTFCIRQEDKIHLGIKHLSRRLRLQKPQHRQEMPLITKFKTRHIVLAN